MNLQTKSLLPIEEASYVSWHQGRLFGDRMPLLLGDEHSNDFHFMLFDLRNGNPNIFYTSQETNLQRVSIMYRVINSSKLFEALIEHDFNEENLRLKLNIVDTFPPENDRSPVIHIVSGKPKLVDGGAFNVEVYIDVAWF